MSDLKPCPFCGCSHVSTIEIKVTSTGCKPEWKDGVCCDNCDASVDSVIKWQSRDYTWLNSDGE